MANALQYPTTCTSESRPPRAVEAARIRATCTILLSKPCVILPKSRRSGEVVWAKTQREVAGLHCFHEQMFNENQSRMRVAEVAKLPCGLLVQTVITRTVSMCVTGLHLDLLLEDRLEKCGQLEDLKHFSNRNGHTPQIFSSSLPC